MITLVYGESFRQSARKLPIFVQYKLAQLLVRLQNNPFDPLLHTKYLTGDLAGWLSFRITRDWRVIFCFLEPHTIKLIKVKHRKDIYR